MLHMIARPHNVCTAAQSVPTMAPRYAAACPVHHHHHSPPGSSAPCFPACTLPAPAGAHAHTFCCCSCIAPGDGRRAGCACVLMAGQQHDEQGRRAAARSHTLGRLQAPPCGQPTQQLAVHLRHLGGLGLQVGGPRRQLQPRRQRRGGVWGLVQALVQVQEGALRRLGPARVRGGGGGGTRCQVSGGHSTGRVLPRRHAGRGPCTGARWMRPACLPACLPAAAALVHNRHPSALCLLLPPTWRSGGQLPPGTP